MCNNRPFASPCRGRGRGTAPPGTYGTVAGGGCAVAGAAAASHRMACSGQRRPYRGWGRDERRRQCDEIRPGPADREPTAPRPTHASAATARRGRGGRLTHRAPPAALDPPATPSSSAFTDSSPAEPRLGLGSAQPQPSAQGVTVYSVITSGVQRDSRPPHVT